MTIGLLLFLIVFMSFDSQLFLVTVSVFSLLIIVKYLKNNKKTCFFSSKNSKQQKTKKQTKGEDHVIKCLVLSNTQSIRWNFEGGKNTKNSSTQVKI